MKENFEARLEGLRKEARATGSVSGRGVNVTSGPVPLPPNAAPIGYAGEAIVKPPVWTWEIPVYFFVGGLAGMSPAIAAASWCFDHQALTRAALWMAVVGSIISPLLLVMDLGRPARFLNMLRVFKIRSPMSVGAWILTAFGAHALPTAVLFELLRMHSIDGSLHRLLLGLTILFISGETIWGLLLATYTGVLIGATVVPAWYLHRIVLPIHFGTVGLGCAAGMLELLGHHAAPLNALGVLAAVIETILWGALEMRSHGRADLAVHDGSSGWMIRIADLCTGPASLAFRLLGGGYAAAILFLGGGLLSRFGWIAAGRASGKDPAAVLAAQKSR